MVAELTTGYLCHLAGAEAAVVVNNNAAVTLVLLAAIAAGLSSSHSPACDVPSRRDPRQPQAKLRRLDPPVIARIENDHVVLDPRTVRPEQGETLAELLGSLAPARH